MGVAGFLLIVKGRVISAWPINTIKEYMKQVQYVGAEEINLGRFGIINKGAKIDVYEWEWEGMKGNSIYKLLSVEPSKEERALAERVKPCVTKHFDLRSIPWEKPSLYRTLSSRMSKHTIIKLIKAINEAGGHIEDSSAGEHRNALIDKVVSAVSFMGWDKYTKETRMALYNEAPQSVEESEAAKATRQRVKKSVEATVNDNNL